MNSKREDYSYLLDELSSIVYGYRCKEGVLVDENDEPVSDDINKKDAFYLLYNHAYTYADTYATEDTVGDDYEPFFVLKSYDEFNFLINTMLREYQVFNDVGTGKVSYYPYEKMAEYLFSGEEYEFNDTKKTIINYLETVFDLEENKRGYKRRVKK